MNIPLSLKIGGHEITVIPEYVFRERGDLCGQADCITNEIRLQRFPEATLDCTAYYQTFIHEVLHFIDKVYNSNKLVNDDDMVERLSQGIYQVFKDNKLKLWDE